MLKLYMQVYRVTGDETLKVFSKVFLVAVILETFSYLYSLAVANSRGIIESLYNCFLKSQVIRDVELTLIVNSSIIVFPLEVSIIDL